VNSQAVAEARQLVEQGMSANKASIQVAAKYGVARQTIQKWAKQAGPTLGNDASAVAANARARAREQRAARMEEGLAELAEAFPVLAREVRGLTGRDADGTVRACRGILEMVRLVEGEATSRVEHLGRDEFAAEVARLAAEMDGLPMEG
jgi:hypothetical protein